jgi:hypothetical protein
MKIKELKTNVHLDSSRRVNADAGVRTLDRRATALPPGGSLNAYDRTRPKGEDVKIVQAPDGSVLVWVGRSG